MFDILALIAVIVVAALTRYTGVAGSDYAATFYLGFMLIAAYFFGLIGSRFRLPKISGYIVAGILFGPHLLKILTQTEIQTLRLIDSTALSLIALIAGGELKISEVRQELRSIAAVIVFQILFVFLGIGGLTFLFRDSFPITVGMPFEVSVSIAVLLGVLSVAKSPASTIAIINEYNAKGSMTSIVLGVTVLKDVVVLLLFATALGICKDVVQGGQSFDLGFLAILVLEIGASLIVGALLGLGYILYLKKIRAETEILLLISVVLAAELASMLHLDSLLLFIAAGFVVQNFSEQGDRFIHAIERSVLPVFVLFFSIAGASLDLAALTKMWPFALLLSVFRLLFTFLGTYTGAHIARASKTMKYYGWMGFVTQAGVTLGMAVLVERAFGDWGLQFKTLIVAAIAINDLIGPVMFRYALFKAQETVEFRKAGE